MKKVLYPRGLYPIWYFSQGSTTFNKLKQLLIYVELNLKADTCIILFEVLSWIQTV